jgi:hypothetical protein
MSAFHITAASVCRFESRERFQLDDRWNVENATDLLRAALAGIGALSDELSAARAEALLDEFEREVGDAFVRQDLRAVKVTCNGYQRRFWKLAKEAKYHRHNVGRRTASSLRMARRLIRIGQRKATGRDLNRAR